MLSLKKLGVLGFWSHSTRVKTQSFDVCWVVSNLGVFEFGVQNSKRKKRAKEVLRIGEPEFCTDHYEVEYVDNPVTVQVIGGIGLVVVGCYCSEVKDIH